MKQPWTRYPPIRLHVSRIPLLVLVCPKGRVRRVYDSSATLRLLLRDIGGLLPG